MLLRYFVSIFLAYFITSAYALDLDALKSMDDIRSDEIFSSSDQNLNSMDEVKDFIKTAIKTKPLFIGETLTDDDCSHCPNHLKLTGDINKILGELKKDPNITENEVPVSINRLSFMYYEVKSREGNDSLRCTRYLDHTKNLKPTKLDGKMELMAENVFVFSDVGQIQLLDPSTEEIVYYYRGIGDQKNIIVQAILGKDGGSFRYYYYRPTQQEKNPYNLPSLGSQEEQDSTVKRISKTSREKSIEVESKNLTAEEIIEGKNEFDVKLTPTLETHYKIFPKNISMAKIKISHNYGGAAGVRVGADSKLTLKGNEAALQITDEEGHRYVHLDLHTSLNGETTHSLNIPYEITFGETPETNATIIKGNIVDSSADQIITLSLTDSMTTYVRTEFKKDKLTHTNSYSVAKDFAIDKNEMMSVAVGSENNQNVYVSLQHQKSIKENITMILDVRIDENNAASFVYQVKAKF